MPTVGHALSLASSVLSRWRNARTGVDVKKQANCNPVVSVVKWQNPEERWIKAKLMLLLLQKLVEWGSDVFFKMQKVE